MAALLCIRPLLRLVWSGRLEVEVEVEVDG